MSARRRRILAAPSARGLILTISKLIVPVALALLALAWLHFHDVPPVAAETPATPALRAPAPPGSGSSVAASAPIPSALLTAAESVLRGAEGQACALPPLAGVASAGSDVAARQTVEGTQAFKAFAASLHRIDDTLRSSSEPYANAVAIWLNVPRNDLDEGGVPEAERRRQLAALAVQTTDPRIYAMAFLTCRGSSDNGCHALNARRWAQLDTGNAMPWLYLLDDAVRGGDVSSQEEALFQMTASKRMDDRTYAPVPAIGGAAGVSPGDLMAAYALSETAVGIAAAQVQPIGALTRACKPNSPLDANRAQQCARIADLLFDHSDTPMLRMMGAGMTRRVTGDGGRTSLVSREIDRMTDPAEPGATSCDRLRRQMRLWTQMARRPAR